MARIIILDSHRQVIKKHQELSLTVDKLSDLLYGAIEALDKKDYTTYFWLMADTIDLTMAELVDRLEQEAAPGSCSHSEINNLEPNETNERRRKED